MKFLLAIMMTFFIVTPTVTFSQTDAEILELMQKLEELKKKKAMEEKNGATQVTAPKENPTQAISKEITPAENSSASVFNHSSYTSDELNMKFKKIEMKIARSKYLKDSVDMINSFERDSMANFILSQKTPAYIMIKNNKEIDSVEIEIDDQVIGSFKLPYLIEDLKPGWHKVLVRNDWGYVDYRETKFEGDSLYAINFNLKIPRSEVTVNSTPQGAEIYINDELRGVSPITVSNLKPGEYKIGMKKEGFSSYETKVELNGLFSPTIKAELNEEIPDSYQELYENPQLVAGSVLGVTALVTGILGIIKHSDGTDYFDKAEKHKASSDEYRLAGDKVNANIELEKEKENNQLGTEKKDTANTLLMVAFVSLTFSVPLITFSF